MRRRCVPLTSGTPSTQRDIVAPAVKRVSARQIVREGLVMTMMHTTHIVRVAGQEFLVVPRTSQRKNVMEHTLKSPRVFPMTHKFFSYLTVCSPVPCVANTNSLVTQQKGVGVVRHALPSPTQVRAYSTPFGTRMSTHLNAPKSMSKSNTQIPCLTKSLQYRNLLRAIGRKAHGARSFVPVKKLWRLETTEILMKILAHSSVPD